MISNFFKSDSLKESELGVDVKRFSRYLPYKAGDFRTGDDDRQSCTDLYLLKDNSVLRVYECSSLVLANEESFDTLTSVIKLRWPEGTIIQVMLLSDDYLDEILDNYKSLTKGQALFAKQTERLAEYYRSGAGGLEATSNNPIRNFRLFVSFKIPMKAQPQNEDKWYKEAKEYLSLLKDAESSFNGMKISPKTVEPSGFVTLLHSIFNPDQKRETKRWDITQEISKQIIYADTPIDVGHDYIKFGKTYAACVTPKTYPREVDFYSANSLIGMMNGIKSNEDDGRQIRSKFIYTLNILKGDLKQKIMAKAKQVNMQQAAGSLAMGIFMRRQEYAWASAEMEKGEEFIQIIPILWVFNRDKDRLDSVVSDVKSIWKSVNDMESQREQDYLLPKLFVSALPGGLYGKDIAQLQRDWIVTTNAASRFAALNGGYRGIGKPYMLFIDRRGQLVGFDFFNTGDNRNILITGGSGGGKSFLMNYVVSSHYRAGFRIRIIDVGESYSKLTYMVDGTYIYPLKESIVVNFFETLKLPNFDVEGLDESESEAVMGALAMLTSIIATMAYSRTGGSATEHELTLIELAIKECYAVKQQSMQVDDIADFLDNLHGYYKNKSNGEFILDKYIDTMKIGHFLSESLQKFTTKGEYGRFFNGKSNISLDNQLVVTELNNLPDDLKKVLVLAVSSIISDEVYRGNNQPTLIFLDEAWQTLSENPAAASFVEGLYRKVRKHNGGVGIVTQSVIDMCPNQGKLKHLGSVLTGQSAYHFMIADKNFDSAVEKDIINVSPFEAKFYFHRMPNSKSIGYKYSEIFIKGADNLSAAVRLHVEPFTYLVNTSDPNEKDYIMHLTGHYQKAGHSKKEALTMAIEDCYNLVNKLGGIGHFSGYVKREMDGLRETTLARR